VVHGLTGNYLNTWTKEKDGQKDYCWPRDMLPGLRPDIRVMSFSYDADVAHMCYGGPAAAGDVDDYADELLQHLNAERHFEDAVSNQLLPI
jgi:protein SERAC1